MTEDWKFDIDDIGSDDSDIETSVDSSAADSFNSTVLMLLPMSIIGVYAFVEKAVVLAAMETLLGAGGLALAVTNAFWIVGVVTVAALAIVGIATVWALLMGVLKQSLAPFVVGIIGLLYFGAGYVVATYFFNGVPLLVGFVLASNLIVYAAGAALVLIIVLVALAII